MAEKLHAQTPTEQAPRAADPCPRCGRGSHESWDWVPIPLPPGTELDVRPGRAFLHEPPEPPTFTAPRASIEVRSRTGQVLAPIEVRAEGDTLVIVVDVLAVTPSAETRG